MRHFHVWLTLTADAFTINLAAFKHMRSEINQNKNPLIEMKHIKIQQEKKKTYSIQHLSKRRDLNSQDIVDQQHLTKEISNGINKHNHNNNKKANHLNYSQLLCSF